MMQGRPGLTLRERGGRLGAPTRLERCRRPAAYARGGIPLARIVVAALELERTKLAASCRRSRTSLAAP